MKIALVIDRFLPEKGGGERYIKMLATGYAQKGHEVTIFARNFPSRPPASENIHYRNIRVPSWPGFLRVLCFASKCGREVAADSFDIVHDVGHMVGADVFNPHGGVEQIWLERYFASYGQGIHGLLKRVQRLLSLKEWAVLSLQRRQFLSGKTRRILAISPMMKTQILSHFPQLPPDRVVFVQNPADLSRFNPKNRPVYRNEERKKLGLRNQDIALLFIGNNFRLKGLLPLLKAVKIVRGTYPNLHLIAVGNAPIRPWRRLCRKMGIIHQVSFLGPVKEVERLYAAADIFALPSYYDSAPLVVLEALASGLPVITSRWAGTWNAVKVPETGIVLNDNANPLEIARAIQFFIPSKRRQRALKVAPPSVTTWSLEFHLKRLLEIYQEIARERTHG